jgi:hypothetical protein
MYFFSDKSESTPHETRRSANDPRIHLVLNGTKFRVLLHADAMPWKVRFDSRDTATLNARAGDLV